MYFYTKAIKLGVIFYQFDNLLGKFIEMFHMFHFMDCLLNDDRKPHTKIGGKHVHQSQSANKFVLEDIHLLIEKDEMHLREDKENLRGGP